MELSGIAQNKLIKKDTSEWQNKNTEYDEGKFNTNNFVGFQSPYGMGPGLKKRISLWKKSLQSRTGGVWN